MTRDTVKENMYKSTKKENHPLEKQAKAVNWMVNKYLWEDAQPHQ